MKVFLNLASAYTGPDPKGFEQFTPFFKRHSEQIVRIGNAVRFQQKSGHLLVYLV